MFKLYQEVSSVKPLADGRMGVNPSRTVRIKTVYYMVNNSQEGK